MARRVDSTQDTAAAMVTTNTAAVGAQSLGIDTIEPSNELNKKDKKKKKKDINAHSTTNKSASNGNGSDDDSEEDEDERETKRDRRARLKKRNNAMIKAGVACLLVVLVLGILYYIFIEKHAPSAPSNVSASATTGSAAVFFDVPSSAGSSPIKSYTATSTPGNKVGTGTSSPIVVSGLTNGTSYTFTVTATNSDKTSARSSVSNAVSPIATYPNPPTNIDAHISSSGIVTVTFTAPAYVGGSAVTSYIVTPTPEATKVTGTTSPITMSGLAAATNYVFTVQAVNSFGSSFPSVSSGPVKTLG